MLAYDLQMEFTAFCNLCNIKKSGDILLKILSILILSMMFMTACTSNAKSEKPNPKYASLVMDATTGTIISQRYANKKLHPASLTKMMTLLMVFEAIDRGDLKKTDRVYISKYAASMVPSKFYLKPGEYIKVEDAIYALVTKSANDVAVGLAEKVGKTESRFANLMTSRARSIGMKSTRFKNASGLHNKYQVTTARDMAILARYILQRYPHYYRYFSTRNFNYNGKSYRNHNRLLETYRGMDGFKTGYISAAGFNLVASARQNNRRLIGVVFGGRSSKTRNAHMVEILDAGFRKARNIRTARIVKPPIPKSKPGIRLATAAQTKPATVPTMPALSQAPVTKQIGNAPKVAAIEKKPTQPKPAAAPQPAAKPEENYTSISALSSRNYNRPVPKSTLTRAIETDQFGLIGQGDVDTEKSKAPIAPIPPRSERIALAPTNAPSSPVDLPHPKNTVGKWSIQIGAFQSRVKTDDALRSAVKMLPSTLTASISPVSVPLETTDGTLFRARLGGLSQKQAFEACTYFKDCMTVAPRSVSISAQ